MNLELIIRLLFGFPFVYLVSGFPWAKLLWPQENKLTLRLLLTSFAISLFLTYPAAVLTTILEGQSAAAIYQVHLPHSLFSLSLFFLLGLAVLWRRQPHWYQLSLPKFKIVHFLLFLVILVYSFFVFWNLNQANISSDDYDLGYQAYNLQDGILAARKAFIISFNTHPPLFMTIKHYWLQLVSPGGLETIPPWGFRGIEGVLGIATILAAYMIARDFVDKRAAFLVAAILAVNNYMIFLGRVYLREMYLTFFITLSIHFFQKKNYLITAFLIACGLLIKTSAIVVLPVYLLILLYKKEYKNILKILSVIFIIYLPVFLYNFLAYITTGHMDATFSKIFGLPHPFLTGSSSPVENLRQIPGYLADIYGLPVFVFFIFSTVFCVIKRQNLLFFFFLLSSLLFFIFAGPLREYYLLFLTIPFAIITAGLVSRHSGLAPRSFSEVGATVIFISVILYSAWYSASGQSSVRKLYEPVHGWPELVSKVSKVYKIGDCLEKGNGVNDLAMRAYFQTDDTPKKILLGPNYPHFYKMCDEVKNPTKRIQILHNPQIPVEYKIL